MYLLKRIYIRPLLLIVAVGFFIQDFVAYLLRPMIYATFNNKVVMVIEHKFQSLPSRYIAYIFVVKKLIHYSFRSASVFVGVMVSPILGLVMFIITEMLSLIITMFFIKIGYNKMMELHWFSKRYLRALHYKGELYRLLRRYSTFRYIRKKLNFRRFEKISEIKVDIAS